MVEKEKLAQHVFVRLFMRLFINLLVLVLFLCDEQVQTWLSLFFLEPVRLDCF